MLATEYPRPIGAEAAVSQRVKRLCGEWLEMHEDETMGMCVLPRGHPRMHLAQHYTRLSPWQRARLEQFRQR